jgi:hypothetical protein
VTNPLVYYGTELITVVKAFIALAPEDNISLLFLPSQVAVPQQETFEALPNVCRSLPFDKRLN